MKRLIIFITCLVSCSAQQDTTQKINGLCLVAPPFPVKLEYYTPIVNVNANWVAIVPYAFCSEDQPTVVFNHSRQWYGETDEGISQAINHAHQSNLKVMLKPHLWVKGQGWAGDLRFESTEDLTEWQNSYREYLLHFVLLADSLNVEMISIGTEIRQLTKEHREYWQTLIKQIRKIYSGKLTYSSNWDNFENIPFWKELDYIGIDAYFPLSTAKTPTVNELLTESINIRSKLKTFSKSHLKKVLFTEFGFQSIDYCAAGHWKTSPVDYQFNPEAQANSYQALFETYWDEDWFAGGFAWKWHYQHQDAGGVNDKEFTPQNKLAEKILKNQYSKFNLQ